MTGGPTIATDASRPPAHRTESQPSDAGSRRPDIQGLRAVAVLLVVAFHAGLSVPGGFTGVDVFFVISGFVITAMLLRELDQRSLSFAGFYARRVRRILPASALTISFVAIASIAAISPSAQKTTGTTGIAGSLFTANMLLSRARNGYFDVAPTSNPLLHIWSLSVEEQFYLVFPALLVVGFLIARKRFPTTDPRRVVGAIVGVVAGGSFLVSWYMTNHSFAVGGLAFNPQTAFYLAPTRAWEFAIGALIALVVPMIVRLPRSIAPALALAGAALVVVGAWGISGTTPFPGTAALFPVIGTGLLIVAGTVAANPISTVLSLRPLIRIGDLSYSWYLWHWPFIVFASALFPAEGRAPLIAAAISLLPAWLSFRYLETPIRLDTRIRGRRALTVAVICIVVPAGCSLVLLHAPKPPPSAATKSFLVSTGLNHQDQARRCNEGVPVALLADRCTWPVANAHGRVILIGDSNAGHFVEPAAKASNELGLDLTVATYPDCPFVDLIIQNQSRPAATTRCRNFVTQSLRQIVAEKPNLVLIAASGPLYFTSRNTFRDPTSGQRSTTPEGRANLWSDGLGRVLRQLSAAQIPTVLIRTVAQWESWDARSCAEARAYLAPRSCGADQTRAEVNAFRRRNVAADDRALRTAPAVAAIDFTDALCSPKRCATNRQNLWLYKDGRHLSVPGALTLTGEFRDVIQAHARPEISQGSR